MESGSGKHPIADAHGRVTRLRILPLLEGGRVASPSTSGAGALEVRFVLGRGVELHDVARIVRSATLHVEAERNHVVSSGTREGRLDASAVGPLRRDAQRESALGSTADVTQVPAHDSSQTIFDAHPGDRSCSLTGFGHSKLSCIVVPPELFELRKAAFIFAVWLELLVQLLRILRAVRLGLLVQLLHILLTLLLC